MRKSYSPVGIKPTRAMVEHGASDWSCLERSLPEVPASKHQHGLHPLKGGDGTSCLVVTQDGAPLPAFLVMSGSDWLLLLLWGGLCS